MPYYQPVRTDRLVLPSNSDYFVLMKRRVTNGDKLAAQGAGLTSRQIDLRDPEAIEKAKLIRNIDRETMTGLLVEMSEAAFIRALLRRMITEWNLDGPDGHVVPITDQSIDDLDEEDGEFLIREVRKRLKGRSEAEEGPFEKGSTNSSTIEVPLSQVLPNGIESSSSAENSTGPGMTSMRLPQTS